MKYIEKILITQKKFELRRYSLNQIPVLLSNLSSGAISREKLKQVIMGRYEVAQEFESFLRHIILTIRSSTLTKSLQHKVLPAAEENLKEELGENESYGGPHHEGRKVMLEALGVDYRRWTSSVGSYENLSKKSLPAQHLIETAKKIVSRGIPDALALLWYWEWRISMDGDKKVKGDYYRLLTALEIVFPEFKKDTYKEGDALWHIASHADHDEHHAKLAEDALISLCKHDPAFVSRMQAAIIDARNALDLFWKELGDAVEI